MKKAKLIHLTENAIYVLSLHAAKNKTNFKNLVQSILETEAKKLNNGKGK